MLPYKFQSKLGHYEVVVHGVKVKVSVVEDDRLIREKISELKNLLKSQSVPVMGLDFQVKSNCAQMVLICAGSQCLIIPGLYEPCSSYVPRVGWKDDSTDRRVHQLDQLLANVNICFVGIGLDSKLSKLRNYKMCKTGIGLGNLAARVLKKPNLENSGLGALASVVGMDIKPATGTSTASGTIIPDWNAKIFSEEQVKYAIHDVYGSYLIGNKLVGMISV